MIYSNSDSAALSAMERDRTGNYGEDGTEHICLYCDFCDEPIYAGEEYYAVNDGAICEDCIEYYKRTAERED